MEGGGRRVGGAGRGGLEGGGGTVGPGPDPTGLAPAPGEADCPICLPQTLPGASNSESSSGLFTGVQQ